MINGRPSSTRTVLPTLEYYRTGSANNWGGSGFVTKPRRLA